MKTGVTVLLLPFPVQKHGEITVSMDPPSLKIATSFSDLSSKRPSRINVIQIVN